LWPWFPWWVADRFGGPSTNSDFCVFCGFDVFYELIVDYYTVKSLCLHWRWMINTPIFKVNLVHFIAELWILLNALLYSELHHACMMWEIRRCTTSQGCLKQRFICRLWFFWGFNFFHDLSANCFSVKYLYLQESRKIILFHLSIYLLRIFSVLGAFSMKITTTRVWL